MRYAMFGALIGAVFPLLGTWLGAVHLGVGFSLDAALEAQRHPVLWLLDLMPAIGAFLGLLVGGVRDQLSLERARVAAAHNDIRVATRALEETTRESRQRIADLTRAQNDVDRFAQVAAHDLQAPLHAINSLAQWVREDLGDQLSGEGKEHLELLQLRANRMGNLLNSLQAYATAGRDSGDVELVDMKVLAHQALRRIRGGERFIMTFDGPDEALHTSRVALATVLQSILANCVHHHDMPPGRILVERRDVGQHIECTISDDGPGIPTRYRDRVFGLFTTLERRDALDTTGAGLAVARRVVETRGGSIHILPQDGRGTRVRFTWPREQTAESQSADALARLSLKAITMKNEGPPSLR